MFGRVICVVDFRFIAPGWMIMVSKREKSPCWVCSEGRDGQRRSRAFGESRRSVPTSVYGTTLPATISPRGRLTRTASERGLSLMPTSYNVLVLPAVSRPRYKTELASHTCGGWSVCLRRMTDAVNTPSRFGPLHQEWSDDPQAVLAAQDTRTDISDSQESISRE